MAKIPYLVRRKNVFYFRLAVPLELREVVKSREIVQSLRTQDSGEAERRALKLAAHFKSLLYDLKTGKTGKFSRVDAVAAETANAGIQNSENSNVEPAQSPASVEQQLPYVKSPEARQRPLFSLVVSDFLNHYDQTNKATYTKLVATLPLLIELIGDKPVNQVLQTDLNRFFDDVQKLPVKRKQKAFDGMTAREVIAANQGKCIAEGKFESTYIACVSIFLSWAMTNYRDQGFPSLSVQGAVYRGNRRNGINKQRAATHQELRMLFSNPKMRGYAENPDKAHYWWLPLIGLYTGARINEICQ